MLASSGRAPLSQHFVTQRPGDLPEFDRPPVTEVVLSLQFAELRNYRSVHAGLLWSRFRRAGFTDFSEHSPIEPRFETFGPPETPQPKLKIVARDEMPAPRVWFVKKGGNELVQVQADRFIRNWRKVGTGESYPRYEYIRQQFFKELSDVQSFFDKERLGEIQPNQCEVTYVNLISFKGQVWSNPETAFRALSGVKSNTDDPNARLPELENAQYSARYILTSERAEPIGRLFVSLQPAISSEDGRVLRLELTARGAPITPDLGGAGQFFDLGRDAVVRGFTAITTREMHDLWGRTR